MFHFLCQYCNLPNISYNNLIEKINFLSKQIDKLSSEILLNGNKINNKLELNNIKNDNILNDLNDKIKNVSLKINSNEHKKIIIC